MADEYHRFYVIDDMFNRYTVVFDILEGETGAYCEECEEWVFKQKGDHISTHSQIELFELIVTAHDEDKHGKFVKIADIERFKYPWY